MRFPSPSADHHGRAAGVPRPSLKSGAIFGATRVCQISCRPRENSRFTRKRARSEPIFATGWLLFAQNGRKFQENWIDQKNARVFTRSARFLQYCVTPFLMARRTPANYRRSRQASSPSGKCDQNCIGVTIIIEKVIESASAAMNGAMKAQSSRGIFGNLAIR